MSHTGAAYGLHESLFNDAVLDVESQFAGTLLRCAPADAVGQAGDVLYFLCVYPLALFRDRGVGVVGAFCDAAHLLHFFCVNHILV